MVSLPRRVSSTATALAIAMLATSALAGGSAAAPDEAPSLTACAERAVRSIQGRYETLRDLSARFEQTTWQVALGGGDRKVLPARGRVVFAKPGKMRWSYEEPEPSEVVSDGETLWLYDPAHREVQRLPVGDGYMSGAAIQFLLGQGDMTRDFRIREKSCADDEVVLELVPRRDASYERLEVVTAPATGELLVTRVVDLLGNVTEVAFTDIEVNRDPPEATFTFEVPEGVRTIDLAPQAP